MIYDVFLSHNSQDKPHVLALEAWLSTNGVRCFLDAKDLLPGDVLTDALGKAMEESQSAVICIGEHGEGPWHGEEANTLLSRSLREARTKNEFRLIPVLLPGADTTKLRWFLQTRLWVDLSNGITGSEADLHRLKAAILGERGVSVPADPGFNPYRGLEAFQADDASFFFGRAKESTELAQKLSASRFCIIVGPSGNGKSSLARAGLSSEAALKTCPSLPTWKRITVKPGQGLLRSLLLQLHNGLPPKERGPLVDAAIATIMPAGSGLPSAEDWAQGVDQQLQNFYPGEDDHVLLLIDQFEEIFTHRGLGAQSEQDRQDRTRLILDGLARLRENGTKRWRVLITMRSDFYQRCRVSESFWSLLEKDHLRLNLDELNEDGWREAIKGPAARSGAYLEAGLVETMLKDVYRQRGSMPLLQLALQSLWTMRDGACLTHAAYTSLGGVANALQQRAETCLTQLRNENPEYWEISRNLFIRLISPGEGVSDTRRRADWRELVWENTDPVLFEQVLSTLTHPENRLLVTDGDSVEIVHEVLIRDSSNIRGWIEDARPKIPILRRLSHAARKWEDSGRNAVFLSPADPPRQLKEWIRTTTLRLTPIEREFWVASRSDRSRIHREKRQTEMLLREEQLLRLKASEAARKAAEASQIAAEKAEKQIRWRSRIAIGVALVALGAAGGAIYFKVHADLAKGRAIVARDRAEKTLADFFYHRIQGVEGPTENEENALWELAGLPSENGAVRNILLQQWHGSRDSLIRMAANDFAGLRSVATLSQSSRNMPELASKLLTALLDKQENDFPRLQALTEAVKALPPSLLDKGCAEKVLLSLLDDEEQDIIRIEALTEVFKALPASSLGAGSADKVLMVLLESDGQRIEALTEVFKALPPSTIEAETARKVLVALLDKEEKGIFRLQALPEVFKALPPSGIASRLLAALLDPEEKDVFRLRALATAFNTLPPSPIDAATVGRLLAALLDKAEKDESRIEALARTFAALPPPSLDPGTVSKVFVAMLEKGAEGREGLGVLADAFKRLPPSSLDSGIADKVLQALLDTEAQNDFQFYALTDAFMALPHSSLGSRSASKLLEALLSKKVISSDRTRALAMVFEALPPSSFDAETADRILAALLDKENKDTFRLEALTNAFAALPPALIAAGTDGELLVALLDRENNGYRLNSLAVAFKALPPAAFSTGSAEKILAALLDKEDEDGGRLAALTLTFQALSASLSGTGTGDKILAFLLDKENSGYRLESLAKAFEALPPSPLDADYGGKLFDAIMDKEEKHSGRLQVLAGALKRSVIYQSEPQFAIFIQNVLRSLSSPFDPERRNAIIKLLHMVAAERRDLQPGLHLWTLDFFLRAHKSGDFSLTPLPESQNQNGGVHDNFAGRSRVQRLCAYLAENRVADLVDVLKWPICGVEGRQLVLEAIENAPRFKGKGVKFGGNLWAFVALAPSLGITNLDTSPKRPTLEAAIAERNERSRAQPKPTASTN